ncbi:MAG: hypothetical protein J6B48_08590 [Clostridia bacterium]|nr:hypothetical protein [Clostridia bacterium]
MQENKNTSFCQSSCGHGGGAICIDTMRVLDGCRDRDCFEDIRVYLSACGEQILANSTNVRTRSAKLLWAFVGVNEVPFNNGFYQITVRYYIEIEFEACVGSGRSQCFKGLVVVEKDVILYGGEGRAYSFKSSPESSYCAMPDYNNCGNNDPVAIVETVEPIILGTKVVDCNCACVCTCNEYYDIPEGVRCAFGEELLVNTDGPKIYVSLGIFSVIRIVRPAQLLVQATDYCVPDKECTAATNNDNPCALFKNIAFPINQFKGTGEAPTQSHADRGGGCGCKG